MDESLFLVKVKEIIERNGCEIVSLDIENCHMEVEGPEENKLDCAMELGMLVEQYEEAQEKEQEKEEKMKDGEWTAADAWMN
ncbi:MAG: hypothetical protein ACLFOY_03165 [Desulfatibacillaceae bacterium]